MPSAVVTFPPRASRSNSSLVCSRSRIGAAELAGSRERVPGLSRSTPAPLLVVESGERVEHRVEVGRDVQAEHLDVVPDVPDHCELARREHIRLREAVLRAALAGAKGELGFICDAQQRPAA